MLLSEPVTSTATPWPADVSRPVKVAFLLQDFTTGGISQWIYTVCRELQRCDPGGWDFHFIATHGWVIQERFQQIGQAVYLGRPSKRPNWFVWRRVTAYLRHLAPDIVQFSNLEVYRNICRRVKPPVVIDRKAGMRTVSRYDLRGVDAVISQNQQVFDAVEGEAPRTFLAYHGVDIEALNAVTPNRLGFGPEAFVVGQVSRLGEGQNHELLIDAAIALRRRHRQVKLVLIGGTTPQAGGVDRLPIMRAYARPLGENAVLLGPVDEPYPYIAGFNVATCTSTRRFTEGAPRKLIEPMAMGIPCVTTDSGATSEVVDDGVNGFVVPDGDLDGLVRRVEQLIVDAPLYQALASRARKTVSHKFNIVKQGKKVRSIYLRLLAEWARGASCRLGPGTGIPRS